MVTVGPRGDGGTNLLMVGFFKVSDHSVVNLDGGEVTGGGKGGGVSGRERVGMAERVADSEVTGGGKGGGVSGRERVRMAERVAGGEVT